MSHVRFVVYEDRGGEWRWTLLAANNRVIADSGEGYKTRGGATRAANRVRDLAPEALVVRDK